MPELILLFSVASLLFLVMFVSRSQLGYSLAIYGNNPQFFYASAINTLCCFLRCCWGMVVPASEVFFFAQSNGFVDLTINMGVNFGVPKALMIGKFLFSCQRPNLLIPLMGVIVFFLIQQSLLRMGSNLKYFNAFQAVIILLILTYNCRKKTATLDHLGV